MLNPFFPYFCQYLNDFPGFVLYFFQVHSVATLEFANVWVYPALDIISNVADTWEETRQFFFFFF